MLRKRFFFLLSFIFTLLFSSTSVFAYTNNMSASFVIGQSDFASNVTGTGPATFANSVIRGMMIDPKGRLIASEGLNHRVLIWNQVPTRIGQPADMVLGQPDFASNSSNNGGRSSRSLNSPTQLYSDGNRLFVADGANGRVLIWSTFPTTNWQPADVVVGQADFTSAASTCDASHIATSGTGSGMWVYGDKLLIGDNPDKRVFIWNTIPTQNGQPADVVLGQINFTTCDNSSTLAQTRINNPRSIFVDPSGRLYIIDASLAHRVMVWNSIPQTNNKPADLVLGQPDFTTSTAGTTPNKMDTPIGVFSNGTRLFVADNNNNRVLIWNTTPNTNGQSPDIVLGQNDLFSKIVYPISASSLTNPQMIWEYQDKLFISEAGGDRILVFNNSIKNPGLGLFNSPVDGTNGKLKMKGTSQVDGTYTVKSVEYSVNGSDFSSATPTDGSFDSSKEDYFFEFNPKQAQPKDSTGAFIDGYTIRMRSTNTNADLTDRLFFFSPFDQTSPQDKALVTDSHPTFTFHVNGQRERLRENIAKYQIQVRPGNGSTLPWQTIIDSIPVDFATVKGNQENKQADIWRSRQVNNGEYETDALFATYSNESSTIAVRSKSQVLSGSYQWKAVAVDKAGHLQETGLRDLFVRSTTATTNSLPIALLSITGVANSKVQSPASLSLTTSSINPTFYGIAWGGSTITLRMTLGSDTKTYTTTANMSSRFGINIPKGDLIRGKTYTVTVSSGLGEKYGEIYPLQLKIQ